MAYILFGALLFAVGWGLKSAMSVPHPDGLTVILSSTVVLVGSLFWVVVTLHALDLLVAFRRDDRRYLSEFAAAMRPRLRELLVAAPVMAWGRWVTPVALVFAAIYACGIWLVHAPAGWFVVGLGRNGAEYSVLIIACLLANAWAHRRHPRLSKGAEP